MVLIDRKYMPDGEAPSIKVLKRVFEIYLEQRKRFIKLKKYYDGDHAISHRELAGLDLPNNKLVCNHAEYITNMATGYVFGTPIQYSGKGAEEINALFTTIEEDSHNYNLGENLSIYGSALELVYMDDDESPEPDLAEIEPVDGFVVCDTTVKHKPVFGVTFGPRIDLSGTFQGHDVVIYTKTREIPYFSEGATFSTFVMDGDEKEHFFADVPLIEYSNRKRQQGDFEGVITLIDAYNLIQSDRVNDKEQLADAILAISGASFGDDWEEKSETAKFLKKFKILELDEGAKAQWLIKNLTEADVEILKKAIKDDIHQFSRVPCLTDENFASNASGVAMKYKLLGFEQLAKEKERCFKRGLRKRLKLISNVYRVKGKNQDLSEVDITMRRSLPVDEEQKARVAEMTDGFVSWETRLKDYNPELDPAEEKKRLDQEKDEDVKRQQATFGMTANTPPEDEDDEEQ